MGGEVAESLSIDRTLLQRSVSVSGPESAPPIVLVHGVHLGRYSWLRHVDILRTSFRVITLDLPRHGTLENIALTRAHLTEQLRYVTEEVVATPPVLVGYSLGGYVITEFAQEFPHLSKGLVLAGCSLDITAWRRRIYDALMQATAVIPRGFFDRTSQLFFRLTLDPVLAQAIISNPFNPRVFGEVHTVLGNKRFSEMLREYDAPVLFVNGEYDIVFRPQTKHYAKQSNATTHIVRGSDHVFPLRRPEQFCAIITEFSGSIAAR